MAPNFLDTLGDIAGGLLGGGHDDEPAPAAPTPPSYIMLPQQPAAAPPPPPPPPPEPTPVVSETSQAQAMIVTMHESSPPEQVTVTEKASSTPDQVTITRQASSSAVQSADPSVDELAPSATIIDSNYMSADQTDPATNVGSNYMSTEQADSASNYQPVGRQGTSFSGSSAGESPVYGAKSRRRARNRRGRHGSAWLQPRLLMSALAALSTTSSFSALPTLEVRVADASHMASGSVKASWNYPAVTTASAGPDAVLVVPVVAPNKLAARDCDGPCSEGEQGISTSVSVTSEPLAARDTILVVPVSTAHISNSAEPTTFLTRVKRAAKNPKPGKDKPGNDKSPGNTPTKTTTTTTTTTSKKAAVATTTSKKAVAATTTEAAKQMSSSSSKSSSHASVHGSSTKDAQVPNGTTASATPSSSGSSATGDALGDVDIANNDEDNVVGAPMPDDAPPGHPSKPGNSTIEADGADAPPAEGSSAADGEVGSTKPDSSTSSDTGDVETGSASGKDETGSQHPVGGSGSTKPGTSSGSQSGSTDAGSSNKPGDASDGSASPAGSSPDSGDSPESEPRERKPYGQPDGATIPSV